MALRRVRRWWRRARPFQVAMPAGVAGPVGEGKEGGTEEGAEEAAEEGELK